MSEIIIRRNHNDIGRILRGRRRKLGYSQQHIAYLLNYTSPSAICPCETGYKKIPYSKIIDFGKSYEFSSLQDFVDIVLYCYYPDLEIVKYHFLLKYYNIKYDTVDEVVRNQLFDQIISKIQISVIKDSGFKPTNTNTRVS